VLVLWLLEESVPCFLAHVLNEHNLSSFKHFDTTFLTGFMEQTEVESLLEAHNEYDIITKNTQSLTQDTNVPSYNDNDSGMRSGSQGLLQEFWMAGSPRQQH
jgi:hypothetical protein